MKKYVAPEMEMLAFTAEEPVAGIFNPSDPIFNDGIFGGW